MNNFNNIYRGKTVLVTGHTGFKGSWLTIWLVELGAKVIGYALEPISTKSNFSLSNVADQIVDIRGDIRDQTKLKDVFSTYQPEIVFHLAAQALVLESYHTPVETYEVNVMGTINVLQCIKETDSTKVGIFITTDKCYENKEQLWGYRENDPMGGYDPYSSSKGACELAIHSWRQSFFNPLQFQVHGKSIASVRAGNVIGGGDWSPNRLIPDCIRALEAKLPIKVRHPESKRPWQHVLEPLSGYLCLGQKMLENPTDYCEGWNFGPLPYDVISVWEVAKKIVEQYESGDVIDVSNKKDLHEAQLLMLDITKAWMLLDWTPSLTIDEAIKLTIEWYLAYPNTNIYNLCVKQIEKFSEIGEKSRWKK